MTVNSINVPIPQNINNWTRDNINRAYPEYHISIWQKLLYFYVYVGIFYSKVLTVTILTKVAEIVKLVLTICTKIDELKITSMSEL